MQNEVEEFLDNLAIVMVEYYRRLNSIIENLYNDNLKFLFVPRAGFTIFKQLNKYRTSIGQEALSEENLIWINRIIVSNSIIDDELYSKTIDSLIGKSNIRKYQMINRCFGLTLKGLKGPPSNEHISTLIKYSSEKRKLNHTALLNYLESFGVSNICLVDSGWNGSAEKILSDNFGKKYNFSRLNFGSMKSNSAVPSNGIIFQGNENLDDNPLVAFQFCKHIIETLLEPDFRSQIGLVEKENKFIPIFSETSKITNNLRFDFASKVENILNESFSKLNAIEQFTRFNEVAEKLSSSILYPSKDLSSFFSDITVSHDMGTSGEIPIIGIKEQIISDLWPQANYAFYYNEDLVKGYQNSLKKTIAVKSTPITSPVDIITRTMDRPFFLKRALNSVLSQTYTNFNLFIVIDGEPVEPILDALFQVIDDPFNVTIIQIYENKGMEAASNLGISIGNGRYILIHDDDDTLHPHFLQSTVKYLEQNQKTYEGVVTASNHISEVITHKGLEIRASKKYNPQFNEIYLHDILEENTFAPISFVFSRKAFDEIGGFDETLPVLGDWDFNIRFLEKFNIGYIDKLLSNYHHRDIQKDFTYGNTVNTGISKHIKYQPIVRNNFYRRNPAFALSSHLKKIKSEFNYKFSVLVEQIKNLDKEK